MLFCLQVVVSLWVPQHDATNTCQRFLRYTIGKVVAVSTRLLLLSLAVIGSQL